MLWCFRVPIVVVWDILLKAKAWPAWWRGLEHIKMIKAGGLEGIGAIYHFTWKSWLPYQLVLESWNTAIKQECLLEG